MDTLKDYRRLVQCAERNLFPSMDDSISILREIQIHHPVRQHCYVVGALAFLLTGLLNRAGVGLNDGLVRAAAILHDVARHEKDNARFGADLLKVRGYPLVAEIVASHTDMEVNQEEPLSEAEIVYLYYQKV
jgi:HD superfamily phosphodiesterase